MGWSLSETIIVLAFLAVFVPGLFIILNAIRQNEANNRAPRLTADAAVASKRAKVFLTVGGKRIGLYYVTFALNSGDRLELRVGRWEYDNLLREGISGSLTFQGTRYLGFRWD